MRTIYKYPFQVEDVVTQFMPMGSEILAVQVQGDIPCIWAIVDPEAELEVRRFQLYGTGHTMDIAVTQDQHVGTFQLLGGRFVGHLFDVTHH